MENNCLFCKIIAKKIASKIRYEDKNFLVFDDIKPKAQVHALIVPKKHINSLSALNDSDKELIGELILRSKAVAKNLGLESFRLVFNSGRDAGQEIDHLHAHILGGNKLGNLA